MKAVGIVVAVLLVTAPVVAQDSLSGTWNSGLGGMTLKFDSTMGTYTLDLQNQTSYEGDYTVSGQSVTFENAFGSQMCPGVKGIYNFNVLANSVEFLVIEDQCTARRDQLRGTWTNAGLL
ncbi:MAG: hypothetical protein AAF563_17115 [Pseudomonadota bacterium]